MDKKKSLLRVKLLQSKNIKVETKNDIKKDDKILQRDKEDQEIKNMFNEQNKEEHQKEFDNFMKMPEINDNKNNVDFMINDLLGDNYLNNIFAIQLFNFKVK